MTSHRGNAQREMDLLIRKVARIFYQTETVIIVDMLVRHKDKLISDFDLAAKIQLRPEQVRKSLFLLKAHQLVACDTRTERLKKNTRRLNVSYWYINYKRAMDVIQYRIYKLQADQDSNIKKYKCFQCFHSYQDIEFMELWDMATKQLICKECQEPMDMKKSVVEDEKFNLEKLLAPIQQSLAIIQQLEVPYFPRKVVKVNDKLEFVQIQSDSFIGWAEGARASSQLAGSELNVQVMYDPNDEWLHNQMEKNYVMDRVSGGDEMSATAIELKAAPPWMIPRHKLGIDLLAEEAEVVPSSHPLEVEESVVEGLDEVIEQVKRNRKRDRQEDITNQRYQPPKRLKRIAMKIYAENLKERLHVHIKEGEEVKVKEE